MTEQLKHCPFCGGEAILQRVYSNSSTYPTTIRDAWKVTCENGCCTTKDYKDNIYHGNNGDILVETNGAWQAMEAWNRRAVPVVESQKRRLKQNDE